MITLYPATMNHSCILWIWITLYSLNMDHTVSSDDEPPCILFTVYSPQVDFQSDHYYSGSAATYLDDQLPHIW